MHILAKINLEEMHIFLIINIEEMYIRDYKACISKEKPMICY